MEFIIKTDSFGGLTEEQFFHFCQQNDSLRIERNSTGEIIIMSPTGSETGWFNSKINLELGIWNHETKLGYTFDSSTGFTLPNNAVRSADAAFLRKDRWKSLPKEDRKKFAHICPDFVIEILSESDSRKILHEKMKEWIENGCKLAWLIDPEKRETTIYRPNKKDESLPFKTSLSGETILPGFQLHPDQIFSE